MAAGRRPGRGGSEGGAVKQIGPPATAMAEDGAAVRFLLDIGTGDVGHAGDDSDFMTHLTETRDYLHRWGCAPFLCDVGLLHSVYGTEAFQPESSLPVSERATVREVAGGRAEDLVFLNCVMQRETFDAAVARLHGTGLRDALAAADRLPGPEYEIRVRDGDPSDAVTFDAASGGRHPSLPASVHLTTQELVDLATMLLADWLQQVPHHEASMSEEDKPVHHENYTRDGRLGVFEIPVAGWW